MSKQKKLRKIVIDKLYNKNDNPMKQSTRSNAPTQSTPNQPKDFSKAIQNFFQNFESQCAIIYEPVKLRDHKPLKRSLEAELNYLYQNDIKLKLRTQEPLIFSSSMQLIRKNSKSSISLHKNQSKARLPSQSQVIMSKVKQNKNTSTQNKFQKLKTQSVLLKVKSPSQNKIFSKQMTMLNEHQSLKQSVKSLKIQHLKMQIQKSTINSEKQIDQYITNSYMTNSKHHISKILQKNAPKKLPEKPQKVDRIKRIQSLKNLNENGVRKYSYKRDL